MTRFYLCIYQIYFALHTHEWPRSLQKAKHAIHVLLRRFVLPELRLTVRVKSGLSEGLWIRARFPEEASYWRGGREPDTEKAILETARRGGIVYDVGAHIGAMTLGTARLVGESGRVVAFEADPDNVESLRESCLQNHFEDRIDVVHAAVWSRSASQGISFRRGATRRSHGGVDSDGCSPVLADGPTVTVPVITLDDFVLSSGNTPQLVKVDVEGGEYEVLRGGETLFTDARPRIIVEVHNFGAFEQISEWMRRLRYSARWAVPLQGYPRVLFAWPAESPPDL